MKKIVATTVLVLVTATGCSLFGGGTTTAGSPSPTTPQFTEAEQVAITALTNAFSSGKLTPKSSSTEASCLATGLVSTLGTEKLTEYKFIKPTMQASKKGFGTVAMSEEDATATAGVVLGCLKPLAVVTQITEGAGLKKKQVTCLSTKLSQSALSKMLIGYLDQVPPLTKPIAKAYNACA